VEQELGPLGCEATVRSSTLPQGENRLADLLYRKGKARLAPRKTGVFYKVFRQIVIRGRNSQPIEGIYSTDSGRLKSARLSLGNLTAIVVPRVGPGLLAVSVPPCA
jgi:hypothetical protein